MRNYELTYIIHPDLDDSAFKKLNEQVLAWIKDGGGKVGKNDIWGKRKMAYEIKKQSEGNYVHLQLELDANLGAEIERQLQLQESVLRYMIVAVKEKEE